MEISTYILFLLGCLGAMDIALFHSVAHGIRSHADSMGELVTHSLRGPTYAALFLLVPNFEMHGLFAWALMALFVFDVGISIWDFSLEQGSRRFLGGLPSGEYVLHMLMAIVFGALVTSILCLEQCWFSAPTSLVWAPAAPALVRCALSVMAIAVLASGIQDGSSALRLSKLAAGRGRCPPHESIRSAQAQISIAEKGERAEATRPAATDAQGIPTWMQLVLRTAGAYNVVWGTWAVLFPSALFHWAGLPPANYPQIWQCVGMIVGVYGIGYLIAAWDPFRYWPIILVGLLGKTFGPLGMVWSIANSGLPARLAWVCVPNDLIWWWPFSLILLRAMAEHHQKRSV